NGTDPKNPTQSYYFLQGLDSAGLAVIDPTTHQPTRYAASGDPVAGTGSLDSAPSDRRLMLSSGPFEMDPGDTQEIVCALALGRNASNLGSVTRLKEYLDYARLFYDPTIVGTPSPPSRGSFSLARPAPDPARGAVALRYEAPA